MLFEENSKETNVRKRNLVKPLNIKLTADANLCISCGVCKGICPTLCIAWEMQNGMYYPKIDKKKCIQCGLCARVCPGLVNTYPAGSDPRTAVKGEHITAMNAWSKNAEIRHKSASGGVITTIISELLDRELYDVVFCVDTYDYEKQLKAQMVSLEEFREDGDFSKYPKSRYLPVSHENVVSFIKENKAKKRAIIIGTPCALRGISETIRLLNKDRDLYLLIGLFCDKVFNYNVQKYFCNSFSGGKEVLGIHFKNKESGGWPGDMKFLFKDGSFNYQSIEERAKVKEYFMPEKCWYCIDKLNVCADISLGDNYTAQDSSNLGTNSVIIRTERGEQAWKVAERNIDYRSIDIEEILMAQGVDWRLNNLYYGMLYQRRVNKKFKTRICLNSGIIPGDNFLNYEWRWSRCRAMLKAGKKYHINPDELKKQQRKVERFNTKKNKRITFDRFYYAIKRRILACVINGGTDDI